MNAQAAPPERERKKPGRKSETPFERLQRLERETAAARRAVADAEQQRLATIGSAVLAEAENNPRFMDQLRGLLNTHVTTKTGKAAIASLLDHTASPPAASASGDPA